MDGTGDLLEPIVRALGDEHDATAMRYPREATASYEPLVALTLAALPKQRPFIIVAESFSGPLALKVAAKRPPGLRGIALCATFVTNPIRLARSWMAFMVRPFMFSLAPDALVVRTLLGRRPAPKLRTCLLESLQSTTAEVMAARSKAVLRVDARAELANCEYPLLYLQGTRDRVVGKHNLETILAIRSTVAVVGIDAPHLLLQTAPEAAAEAIRAFVTSLPAERRAGAQRWQPNNRS